MVDDPVDAKAVVRDRRRGLPHERAAAADDQADGVEHALDEASDGGIAAYVLEEEELAALTEHAAKLTHRSDGILHRAEEESGDDRVEAGIGEGHRRRVS